MCSGRARERAFFILVATTNFTFVGDRAKVGLLWLRNQDQAIAGPKPLGSSLLVHMVGHIERQCGRITAAEELLFSLWCKHHEEKNTV